MAKWEELSAEGDDDTKKIEIAAFLANIAQETGTHEITDEFGGLSDTTPGGETCSRGN